MGRAGQKTILVAVLISMCELTALQAALAQPPLQKGAAILAHGMKGPEHETPRLDLRAPSQTLSGAQVSGAALADEHRLFETNSPLRTERPAVPLGEHINSPLQNVVHNFQREGLPVARLFQSDTSLVHLGLNPKGKPGLWIVHKLH